MKFLCQHVSFCMDRNPCNFCRGISTLALCPLCISNFGMTNNSMWCTLPGCCRAGYRCHVSYHSHFKGKYQLTLLTLMFLLQKQRVSLLYIASQHSIVLLYSWHHGKCVLYSPVSMHARPFSILTEVQCVVVASTFSDVSVKVTLNTTDTSYRVIVE